MWGAIHRATGIAGLALLLMTGTIAIVLGTVAFLDFLLRIGSQFGVAAALATSAGLGGACLFVSWLTAEKPPGVSE